MLPALRQPGAAAVSSIGACHSSGKSWIVRQISVTNAMALQATKSRHDRARFHPANHHVTGCRCGRWWSRSKTCSQSQPRKGPPPRSDNSDQHSST